MSKVTTKQTSEAAIETYLREQVKKIGGKAYKWVSPGTVGVPDRIVFFNGRVYFVEMKRLGAKPTTLQAKRMEELKSFKQDVRVIDSFELVDKFISELILQ